MIDRLIIRLTAVLLLPALTFGSADPFTSEALAPPELANRSALGPGYTERIEAGDLGLGIRREPSFQKILDAAVWLRQRNIEPEARKLAALTCQTPSSIQIIIGGARLKLPLPNVTNPSEAFQAAKIIALYDPVFLQSSDETIRRRVSWYLGTIPSSFMTLKQSQSTWLEALRRTHQIKNAKPFLSAAPPPPADDVLDFTRQVRDRIIAQASTKAGEGPLEIPIPFTPYEWLHRLASTLNAPERKNFTDDMTPEEYRAILISRNEKRWYFGWTLSVIFEALPRGSEKAFSKNTNLRYDELSRFVVLKNLLPKSKIQELVIAIQRTFPAIPSRIFLSSALHAVRWAYLAFRRGYGDMNNLEEARTAYEHVRTLAQKNIRERRLWNDKDFLPELRTAARFASKTHPIETLWPPHDIVRLNFKKTPSPDASRALESGA